LTLVTILLIEARRLGENVANIELNPSQDCEGQPRKSSRTTAVLPESLSNIGISLTGLPNGLVARSPTTNVSLKQKTRRTTFVARRVSIFEGSNFFDWPARLCKQNQSNSKQRIRKERCNVCDSGQLPA